jgi:transposase
MVAIEPVDFRRGIDGLARTAQADLGQDPFSGAVYIFRNRRATAIKVLVYDGQGFWLCQKRLSRGRFRRWPTGGRGATRRMEAQAAQVLFYGGDFEAAEGAPAWRPVGAVEQTAGAGLDG